MSAYTEPVERRVSSDDFTMSASRSEASNIDRRLTDLQLGIDDLEKAMAVLFERISAVQGPAEVYPTSGETADDSPEQSTIARVAENLNDQVRRMYWRLQRETARIEL